MKINKEAPDVDHLATAYGHSLLVTYPFKFESDTCAYALYVYFTIATHAIAQTWIFNPTTFEHDLGTHACVLNRDVPIVHSDFNLEDMKYKCKMCGSTRDNTNNSTCMWLG